MLSGYDLACLGTQHLKGEGGLRVQGQTGFISSFLKRGRCALWHEWLWNYQWNLQHFKRDFPANATSKSRLSPQKVEPRLSQQLHCNLLLQHCWLCILRYRSCTLRLMSYLLQWTKIILKIPYHNEIWHKLKIRKVTAAVSYISIYSYWEKWYLLHSYSNIFLLFLCIWLFWGVVSR